MRPYLQYFTTISRLLNLETLKKYQFTQLTLKTPKTNPHTTSAQCTDAFFPNIELLN